MVFIPVLSSLIRNRKRKFISQNVDVKIKNGRLNAHLSFKLVDYHSIFMMIVTVTLVVKESLLRKKDLKSHEEDQYLH